MDEAGHADTLILACSARYASCFYVPFRDALDSAPWGGGNKKTCQMDPGNGDEALQEVGLDLEEGSDIVMVKPGMPCLDIAWRVKQAFKRPVAVYQVSGEYAMLKASACTGYVLTHRLHGRSGGGVIGIENSVTHSSRRAIRACWEVACPYSFLAHGSDWPLQRSRRFPRCR